MICRFPQAVAVKSSTAFPRSNDTTEGQIQSEKFLRRWNQLLHQLLFSVEGGAQQKPGKPMVGISRWRVRWLGVSENA
jgi:hypothetical protein